MQGEPGNNNILRVYAPGRSIKKLFGADLIRSNGNIHNIKVPFENQDTEFLDKTVIISFSKVK